MKILHTPNLDPPSCARCGYRWHWLAEFDDVHVCHSCLLEVAKLIEEAAQVVEWQGDPGPRTSQARKA